MNTGNPATPSADDYPTARVAKLVRIILTRGVNQAVNSLRYDLRHGIATEEQCLQELAAAMVPARELGSTDFQVTAALLRMQENKQDSSHRSAWTEFSVVSQKLASKFFNTSIK